MKVSVQIITYNHEKYIAQAMESALMQVADFDYEIVIGEDCSTDSTRDIVIDFQERYPERIRLLLHEKNIGASFNDVQTYQACRGQYIALLEGDDYWTDPFKLQKQVDFLDNHPECAICCHDVKWIYEMEVENQGFFSPPNQKKIYTLDDLLTGGTIFATCTTMYRKGLFGEYPEWFYAMPTGDWPRNLLNAQHGDIGRISECMATYRVHDGGVWSSMDRIQRFKSRIKGYEMIQKYLDLSDPSKKKLNAKLFKIYYLLCDIYVKNGDLANARTYLKKYIRHLRDGRGAISVRRFVSMILRVYSPRLYKLVQTARTSFAQLLR